jgi:hypothetical protein
VALVIVGSTRAPDGPVARALGWGPTAFVGRISYGLYLWHWPIFLVLDGSRTGLTGWALFAVRCAVTFAFAVASWYVVETPVRRLTFTSWRTWAWIPAGAVTAVAVLLATTTEVGATDILLPPTSVHAALARYEDGGFPPGGTRLRVLVVGDSLSLTVGFWTSPYGPRYDEVLRGRQLDGCGLVTTVPYVLHGTPTYPLAPCAQWPTIWGQDVARLRPQVVLLVVGWWECMDRLYQGRYQHLGEPAFDAYERSRLEQAVRVLTASGAHLDVATAPYFDSGRQLDGQPWDEDDPARVDRLNQLIVEVAAGHRRTVSVVPLHRWLDPDGHYAYRIDGQVMRFADGVHTTEAAGTYLAPRLLPLLAASAPSR